MLTPQMTWKCGEYCWYVFTIMVNLTFTLLTPELGEGSAKLQLIENTHRGHVLLRSLSTSLRVSAHCSWPLALWSLCFATWAHIYVFNAMRIGHFSLHRCDRNWPTTISTFNTFNCLLIVCYFKHCDSLISLRTNPNYNTVMWIKCAIVGWQLAYCLLLGWLDFLHVMNLMLVCDELDPKSGKLAM